MQKDNHVSKKEKMLQFWSERALEYQEDLRANTNDIWIREIEIRYINQALKQNSYKTIMDFGCANGYSTIRIAKENPEIQFLGIDINQDMLNIASTLLNKSNVSNLEFKNMDITNGLNKEKFDLIYTIRAIQNIESFESQKIIFDSLYRLLNKKGILIYIESYAKGYQTLNEDRIKMGLNPLPIHEHLTLLTEEFDHYVASKMKFIKSDSLSSSYYLATRLLYSYIAKMSGEPIDYNHPIHQVAAIIPQIGEYGPQKASMYRKM